MPIKKNTNKLSQLYRTIDQKELSKEALDALAKLRLATGNFRKQEGKEVDAFKLFFDRLIKNKPTAVKTTSEYKAMIKERRSENGRKAMEARKAKQESRQGQGSEEDSKRPAKPFGWRLKGKHNYRKPTRADISTGKAYYEARINRADTNRTKFPMLERGGKIFEKLEEGVYKVGKPNKVAPNLYEQKIVEIFANGDISTASDYGRKLSDFSGLNYPMISKEQLDAQYNMERGGFMAKGGAIKTFNTQQGIGKSKYVISYHDGIKKHKDGSNFFDIKIYKNKIDFEKGIADFKKQGYIQKSFADGGFMAEGGKLDYRYIAKLIHRENGVEYYKNDNLIFPTKEEKLLWEIMGLPNGVEKNEVKFETIVDAFYANTKKDIYNQFDDKLSNGYYNYLGSNPDLVVKFNNDFAKGGAIENQYEDRTPEDIWDSYTKEQKLHFLYDHREEINEYKAIESEDEKPWFNVAYKSNWDDLDMQIKNRFANHVRGGQYADGGFMEHGGEVGEYFKIADMNEKLNRMFPDSFGFSVGNFKTEGQGFINSSALIANPNDPFRGLKDTDIGSKLFFPQYKQMHDIRFRIYQGGENTYFYFNLESEKGDEYIGQFGFKDQGNVPSSYITRFIAFLMEQYGLPFEVNHSVMADGGYMAEVGGYGSKKELNEDFKRIIQAPKSKNIYEQNEESYIGKFVTIKLPNEVNSFRTKVSREYEDMVVGSGKHNGVFSKKYIISKKYADGGFMEHGGEMDMLMEDQAVWNAVGTKLLVDKVTNDEYYLRSFMQIGSSPFSKEKVHRYLKNGEWTLKPKMDRDVITGAYIFAKGGVFYTDSHKQGH